MKNRMKGLILAIFMAIGSVTAQDLPSPMQPPRLVNDFANLLSQQELGMLEQKLRNYHDTTSTQIYVITVNDLKGYDIADFTFRVGEKWGVGQEGKDNGAIILVRPKVRNKRGEAYIATGYGLEDVIPDAIAKRILERELLPRFRNNDFYAGFNKATSTMMELASGKYSADEYSSKGGVFVIFPIIIFLTLIFIVLFNVNRTKGRSIGHNIPFLIALGMMSGAGRSGGFGSFSSGGGSFGGFSGGGGGSFGGGGAGGSW